MAFIGNTNITQSFTPAIDYFSGNGSSTAFTLSRPVASVAQVQVTIDNVAQNPSTAFSVSGNTITFTSAPLSGTNNIYVYYTSPITQVIAPSQGTVSATSFASSTGTGSVVLQTSPTITTPTISSLTSASATNLTLQSAGTTALTIDTSQNVGIGTTSPTALLTIGASSGTPGYNINYTGSPAATIAGQTANTSTGELRNFAYTNYFPTFYSNNAERMRIASDGTLYVRSTGATAPWDATTGTFAWVGQGTYPLGLTSQGNIVAIMNRTTSTGSLLEFKYNGAFVANISTTGSAVAYNTTSDYRLKENIVPMTGALDKVAQLKPSNWTWKSTGENGQGFIAHELKEVVPDCVYGEKDAVDEEGKPIYQGVDTSFLVATLTAAIQEQQTIINDLKARIETLEGK
jgi:hypothetical protein